MIGRFKCEMCLNFFSGDPAHTKTWKCKAFPNGIPEAKIYYLSRDPCLNCNNGIGYEPEKYTEQWEEEKAKYAEEFARLEKMYHELHEHFYDDEDESE